MDRNITFAQECNDKQINTSFRGISGNRLARLSIISGLAFLLFQVTVISKEAWSQDIYVFDDGGTVQHPEVVQKTEGSFFSDSINLKLSIVNDIYTRKISKDPRRYISCTEIDKPDLYYSIQKLTKYYFKCLKKGILPYEKAESEFASILDKCIRIYPQETTSIEAELRSAGSPREIVDVFDKIVIRQAQM